MDTTTTRHVRHATSQQDIETAATIIAEAFAALQATEWLVPDPSRRTTVLKDVFTILAEHAQAHGQVDLLIQPTPNGEGNGTGAIGAAVWLRQTQPIPPPPHYDERLLEAAGPDAERFQTLDRLFGEQHPADRHHYLALLAALPANQGTKVGSALLLRHHADLAELEMPAYLEAADARTRDLYLTHGYRPHGEPFRLPNGAMFHPMWRTPEPTQDIR